MKFLLVVVAWGLAVVATAAADNPAGYSLKSITMPAKTLEISGLGIDGQDRVFVVTRAGEIWRYDPDGSWHSIAQGFHEPAGLHVSRDASSIYVAQKPELTILEDRDGDGRYEHQSARVTGFGHSGNYHEFHYGPVFDSRGRIYGALNLGHGKGKKPATVGKNASTMTHTAAYRGWAYRSDRAGHFLPFASGLRSSAGISMSPNDELFITDNQGDWVPTSALYHVRQDSYQLHPASLLDHPWLGDRDPKSISNEELAAMQTEPAVWIPHAELANSPGTPVWDATDGKFGPFAGQIFTGDQTQSNVFRMGVEKVSGHYQGWCINFMSGFKSGVVRGAFDSQGRYWAGQTARGWTAVGGELWGLEVIEYDGTTTPFALHRMSLEEDGFRIFFTKQVDPKSALPMVERWRYNRNNKYGSPKVDQTKVGVTAEVADDGLSALLKLDDMPPGFVYAFKFVNVVATDGSKPANRTIYYTLNRVHGQEQLPTIKGYVNTPEIPGTGWGVHDPRRPQPVVVEPPPFQAAPPPADAVVLEWTNKSWQAAQGVMTVGTKDNSSKQNLGDGHYHVEFKIPAAVKGDGQNHGNSGVFLMSQYEIQVLGCYENQTYPDGQCAALYGQQPPRVNACRPNEEWQSYDILWRAPRFDNQGQCIEQPRVTVIHNGVLVQDDVAYISATRHKKLGVFKPHAEKAPLRLQDHSEPVSFRNIWHVEKDYEQALQRFRASAIDHFGHK